MANDLTITDEFNNSDLALLDEAGHDLTAGDMVGVPLKFVKGVWQKKNTDQFIKVAPTQTFIVDVLSYEHGWIRWEDKKPTHRCMGRKVDHHPLPDRSQLPEKEMAGAENDPWQQTHRIVMRDLGGDDAPTPTHDGLCTYTTTSWGGRKALGRLLKEFVRYAKDHPGQMPVVYLGSKEGSGAMGTVDYPTITIVGWREFGPGQSPAGKKPIAATPAPQLTHVGGGEGSDDDDGKPATIMSNGKVLHFKPDDIDEIPF